MPEYLTSRVDVRRAVLATAATLASNSKSLSNLSLKIGSVAAASGRLAAAEEHLVEFANSLATYVNTRYPVGSPDKETQLVLKVDNRCLEAFSRDWLSAAEPPPSQLTWWQMAHLVNAIDFGRWIVSLAAGALATQAAPAPLQTGAVRTILHLDLALTELTRSLLGAQSRRLVDWNAQ